MVFYGWEEGRFFSSDFELHDRYQLTPDALPGFEHWRLSAFNPKVAIGMPSIHYENYDQVLKGSDYFFRRNDCKKKVR